MAEAFKFEGRSAGMYYLPDYKSPHSDKIVALDTTDEEMEEAWQEVKAKRPHLRPKSRRAGAKPDKTRSVQLEGAQQQVQPRAGYEEDLRSHKLLKPAARLARSLVDV
eukprot:4582495-Pyramimonas_sp.AAC.1